MVVGGTLSLLFFVSVERERETRRAEGSAWSAPRSVWYKVGCVFWVAESGGACAGGGTRRGESGRSNQHKEERVRVEESILNMCAVWL